MRDTSLEMRRAKAFHHLNSSYFESALIFCTVLFYIPPFSTPFTRIPNLLLTFSYLVHPYPESALIPFESSLLATRTCSNLFASRLPVSRIYSYSLRISFTRIPNLLLTFSYLVHPYPESALNLFVSRLPASRICSYSLHI